MNDSFLSDRGRKYARYVYLINQYIGTIRIQWLKKFCGKFILPFVVSFVYITILKEGAAEHARRKAEMSRMRSGASASGKRAAGEMREMRISSERLSSVSPLVQASGEGRNSDTSTEEKI